jgi:acid stress-induced BolA-like protein IbaG/YrbA
LSFFYVQGKIKDELQADSVVVSDVYGDGRHVSIDVVSNIFEGKPAAVSIVAVFQATAAQHGLAAVQVCQWPGLLFDAQAQSEQLWQGTARCVTPAIAGAYGVRLSSGTFI